VSYFEWVQDRMGYFWDEGMVVDRLNGIMTNAFHDVLAVSQRHSVNMRVASYMLAIERVAAVHRLRGLYA
jgi:glutamate dehydrogenase (NAD(P)+)